MLYCRVGEEGGYKMKKLFIILLFPLLSYGYGLDALDLKIDVPEAEFDMKDFKEQHHVPPTDPNQGVIDAIDRTNPSINFHGDHNTESFFGFDITD